MPALLSSFSVSAIRMPKGRDEDVGLEDAGGVAGVDFFGNVTADLLRRSDHRRVQALEADIRGSMPGTKTPSRAYGPVPPTRSSAALDDLCSGSQILVH